MKVFGHKTIDGRYRTIYQIEDKPKKLIKSKNKNSKSKKLKNKKHKYYYRKNN